VQRRRAQRFNDRGLAQSLPVGGPLISCSYNRALARPD